MAHTERVNTLFRGKTIGKECKIFLSFLMSWTQQKQLKEIPGAQKHFWINQHSTSALLQQGGVAQLYNLFEYGATGDGDGQESAHRTPANTPETKTIYDWIAWLRSGSQNAKQKFPKPGAYTPVLSGMPMAIPSHHQELRRFDSQDSAGPASKPQSWAVSGDRHVRKKNPSALLSQSLPWPRRVKCVHMCAIFSFQTFFSKILKKKKFKKHLSSAYILTHSYRCVWNVNHCV